MSLINAGIDKYLLSYYKSNNKIEFKLFKYTSYEGYQSKGNYVHNLNNNRLNNYLAFYYMNNFRFAYTLKKALFQMKINILLI